MVRTKNETVNFLNQGSGVQLELLLIILDVHFVSVIGQIKMDTVIECL